MNLVEPPPKTLTAVELMEMADDGVERDIIRGELREKPMTRGELREKPMTRRNPDHSEVELKVGYALELWVQQQPRPRGRVSCGEVGFRLSREPETFVGIDVAYVSAEMARGRDRKLRFYDGPPVLAVEILSPSDQHENIVEKVELYLEVGVVVWVVDPHFRTVAVHRAGQSVEVHNDRGELIGDPELPGFRVAVARFFED